MNNQFDDLLNEVRDEQIDPAVIEQAAARVWQQVAAAEAVAGGASTVQQSGVQQTKIRGCADFEAMLPAWRAGTLPEARRALVEDHLHECVACRRAAEVGKILVFPHLAEQAPVAKKPSFWTGLAKSAAERPGLRFAMAAGLFALLGIGGWNVVRSIMHMSPAFHGSKSAVQTAEGQLFRLHNDGLVAVKAGEELPAGEEVRTGRNSHAVIRLKDGSLVEMKERSAFVVQEASNDLNVQLARGAVIVQAAHRSAGHLFVTTPDTRIAVTGTVFSVESGLKGSRVSVAEGEVRVSPVSISNNRTSEAILHPGDQTSSDASMERTPIREAFSWSTNATQYGALLAESASIEKDLAKIEQPGMRYSSNVLSRLPSNTVFYVSLPNVGKQLGQAQEIMAQHVQESPALQQWWKQQGSGNSTFNKVIDSIKGFSEYVGDEVVITAATGRNRNGTPTIMAPMLVAELKRSGFKEYAQTQFAAMTAAAPGSTGHIRFVDDPSTLVADGSSDMFVSTADNMLVITDGTSMRTFGPAMKASSARTSDNAASPFMARLQQSYQGGIGFLFAADLGTMTSIAAQNFDNAHQRNSLAPLGNVSYLLVEQRDAGTTTDTHATLTFAGERQGMFAWLAKPGPMAALEYVTANATAATGFTITNPGQVIDDIMTWASSANPNFPKDLSQAEADLGFSIRNDLAASLGSEVVFAVDGPLLPVPSWKVVAEVYDPGKLEWVFTKLIDDANSRISKAGGSQLQVTQQSQNNLIYYKIISPDVQPLGEIDYVFTGGYLIMAPSRSLLDQAIQTKANGDSLPHSAAFRSTLPQDREANFSALAYSNAGGAVSGLMTMFNSKLSPADRKRIETSAADGKPALVGAYGESDRIVISSQGLIGLGSGSFINMAGPFSLFTLIHGTSHGTN